MLAIIDAIATINCSKLKSVGEKDDVRIQIEIWAIVSEWIALALPFFTRNILNMGNNWR